MSCGSGLKYKANSFSLYIAPLHERLKQHLCKGSSQQISGIRENLCVIYRPGGGRDAGKVLERLQHQLVWGLVQEAGQTRAEACCGCLSCRRPCTVWGQPQQCHHKHGLMMPRCPAFLFCRTWRHRKGELSTPDLKFTRFPSPPLCPGAPLCHLLSIVLLDVVCNSKYFYFVL